MRRRVPIIFAGFDLNASYSYDSSQRLGNPPLTQLSNRESQISGKLSFEYDSFTDRDFVEQAEGINDKRKRLRHLVTMDFGFDLQNSNLKSNGLVPLVPPLDGRVVYPSLNMRYLATYDLRQAGKRGGIGEIDFLLTATGQKGLTTFGGDFDYRQYEISGAAQMFFGFTSTTDLFLRYQRGFGASSNTTPLFKVFRLGGSLNVRGLEEGEFVGDSYAYDRTELGISLLPMLRTIRQMFPGKKKSDRSGPNTARSYQFWWNRSRQTRTSRFTTIAVVSSRLKRLEKFSILHTVSKVMELPRRCAASRLLRTSVQI